MIYRFFHYAILIFIVSCGFYSFKGALPPQLKTIYINDFLTSTAFYNIEQEMTVGVTDAFIEDNTLEIVSEPEKGDLLLKGRITSIKWEPYSVAEGAVQSKEDRLTVTLSVDCFRRDLKKNLWKKSWERYALLPTTATQTEVEEALNQIVDDFSEDTVLNTVAAW